MSMVPGDFSSRIRAYESGLGPNPFQRMRPDVMPMQPPGGIAGLFDRLRASGRFQPQYPVGGGGFPGMQRGFPGGGGGFFGGFRPRLRRRRRPPPQMPDYSSQFSSLEAKIKELQDQLAARQTATPLPDPVANLPEPRVGTLGGTGVGEYPLGTAGPRNLIPQIDPVALKELQDRIAGASAPMAPPVSVPDIDLAELGMEEGNVGAMMPLPRRGGRLPRGDVGGRKMINPPSIERIMPPMPQVPDVMPQMPMPEPLTIAKPMPMPVAEPMPDMPRFYKPQIDPMGRVAAPLTRGPVNTAINRPMVGMRGPGARMR